MTRRAIEPKSPAKTRDVEDPARIEQGVHRPDLRRALAGERAKHHRRLRLRGGWKFEAGRWSRHEFGEAAVEEAHDHPIRDSGEGAHVGIAEALLLSPPRNHAPGLIRSSRRARRGVREETVARA